MDMATEARARDAGPRRAYRLLLREPLVHFAALGALLFALWRLVQPSPGSQDGAASAATPAAAVSRTVNVTARDVETLEAGFGAAWKRAPDAGELADLVEAFIGEELLFREGMALGLDRDDAMVRRRVIEKATMLARPSAPAAEPTADELRRWYELYPHRFRQPGSASLEQLYFDARRHADPQAAARAALGRLAGQPAGAPPPAGVGDSFVLPGNLSGRSEMQLAHLFGAEFAAAVMAAPLARWHGPVRSTYGFHLVRVSRREQARMPPFAEVEKHVRADWLTTETRGVRAAARNLSPRYRVELTGLPEATRARLAGSPALAPFLGRRP
jgi:peptidyl-prolyl cis-trans isomerase C